MADELSRLYEFRIRASQRCGLVKREFLSRFGAVQNVDELQLSLYSNSIRNKGAVLSKCQTITQLPAECLEHVFKQLPFGTVAKMRLVCQHFNTVASSLLNSEFSRLRISVNQKFQSIKAQMPRRESARRKHPLSRENDIIETLHMRLTLLQMVFGKHIERQHCCFFAGEILDEVYRILHYVKTNSSLTRAYKVTDELFDLSTMAMEYFKEHIEPSLPEITCFSNDFFDCSAGIPPSFHSKMHAFEESVLHSSTSTDKVSDHESSPSQSVSPAVNKKFRKIRENIKRHSTQITALKRESKCIRKKSAYQQKQINVLKEGHRDFNKKVQCITHKMNLVVQELNHCTMELQHRRSQFPAAECSNLKFIPIIAYDSDSDDFSDRLPGFIKTPKVQESNEKEVKPINPESEPAPSCSYSHSCHEKKTPVTVRRSVTHSQGSSERIPSKEKSSKTVNVSAKRKLDMEDQDLPLNNKKFQMHSDDSTCDSDSAFRNGQKNELYLIDHDVLDKECDVDEDVEHNTV